MESKKIFEVGQIVRFTTGDNDLKMNVKSKGDFGEILGEFDGTYECQWFAGKKLQSDTFPHELLLVKPEDKRMASEKTFEVGQNVQLTSGGPNMKVESKGKKIPGGFDGTYECRWLVGGKKLQSGTFPHDSLELVKPNDE